ncbi:uncharacterized protein LOC130719140 [Lotus japonicus]|uniref:uncharacterized protein LOC130719140 n=1 Tax=Lotus japonicus TaxID=34305 RepID=UPI0025826399|nr:uncharacterized protein LOC130719140 [Lotus japonicus]
MDRKWMCANRLSQEYGDGVKEFISFAIKNAEDCNRIICPCLRCCHGRRVNASKLEDHLVCYGIDENYTCWTKHGERRDVSSSSRANASHTLEDDADMFEDDMFVDDRVEEIVNMVEDDFRECPEMFEKLKTNAEMPLYDGCTKFTKLSGVLNLYNLKAGNGWTDKSFTELLALLKNMLPEDNVLPSRNYEAKQMLCSIGLSYEKIHACPRDCILFRNEYKTLKNCPKCTASRYKKKGSCPAKVVWYFPIIPRFRRMYNSAEDAKHLRWHADERIDDRNLRHPSDSPQWKKFDRDNDDFGKEARNLRLALATDGMNPHNSGSHSIWPVILMIYNLPPWLCMKRKYMMLTMLISGPTQPGNDIDVYLAPLIEDLKQLWETGVEVYDKFKEEKFILRAMLFGTINDFPAYGNVSGYTVKGQCACPICEDDTYSIRLQHCQKNVYLGHRRFLHPNHKYRGWRKAFNGNTEEGLAPTPSSRADMWIKVKDLCCKFGKDFSKELPTRGWKKRSIFFELPYWKSLYVRHFLDVMHIEKNVFESVINTLLHVPGKSKDSINARLDMVNMGIRAELEPVQKGKRTYLPPAAHTLSKNEKISFFECLNGVKVPEGYSSNIRNLVSMKDLKLKGLKSHDCHVLMENFLPIAIRSILPKKVQKTITKLCFFFKAICSKMIDPERLPLLQKEIVVTLCELEMYFPPSFFDIMIHLTVHLVRETQFCGPAYMRWMYPVERYMKVLKGYVKNRSRPEGCMVERYIVEEAIEFCTEYLSNAQSIGLPKSRHSGKEKEAGEGIIREKIVTAPSSEREKAHLYVLHNTTEVDPYVEKHKYEIRTSNPNRSENWIAKEHNKTFITWLRDCVHLELEENPNSISERLRWLSKGPSIHVFSYTGYLINGYTFYTKEQDDRTTMQNSGVTLIAQSMHISSAKDKNPVHESMSYFGVIELIWELDYTIFQVPVFGCRWVDNNNGVRIDDLGFTQVDLNRVGYKNDPFILASQAEQVFFVTDPADKKWSIVQLSNKINDNKDYDENQQKSVDKEDDPFKGISHSLDDDLIEDDDLYMRDDHVEGIWIDQSFIDKERQTSLKLRKKRKRMQ